METASEHQTRTGSPRQWWLAGLLSYLQPGLGQVYNGQGAKGLRFLGAGLISLAAMVLCLEIGSGLIYVGLFLLFAYLLITLVVAGSALAIYNQGGFGVGHILAVLTLTALLTGYLLETLAPFGKWSVYLQTGAYTATVLFHMIPAITDFLRRLPVGDPFVDSLDAPLVQSFHLAFLAAFIVGVLAQWMWLTRTRS